MVATTAGLLISTAVIIVVIIITIVAVPAVLTRPSPISVAIPAFGEGSAAAVIRVSSPIGSTEFKFPVRRKT